MRFNHKLPQFVSPVPDSLAVAVDALTLPWEDLDAYRHIGQSGGEATGLPVQKDHYDCPGVAQHALVLGLGDHVQSGPSQPAQSADTALQSDPSQKSDKSKSPCLAPRATKIKEQGFSEAVAARVEAPQRRSTRSVYEAKWAIFTKWCITNQVDFRSPPVKSVADFLMYLFEDKKLQPCLAPRATKKNRASLRQWQQELRLLKEDLPDQSMRQSGPFLQSGASLIRWTSSHHL